MVCKTMCIGAVESFGELKGKYKTVQLSVDVKVDSVEEFVKELTDFANHLIRSYEEREEQLASS